MAAETRHKAAGEEKCGRAAEDALQVSAGEQRLSSDSITGSEEL